MELFLFLFFFFCIVNQYICLFLILMSLVIHLFMHKQVRFGLFFNITKPEAYSHVFLMLQDKFTRKSELNNSVLNKGYSKLSLKNIYQAEEQKIHRRGGTVIAVRLRQERKRSCYNKNRKCSSSRRRISHLEI